MWEELGWHVGGAGMMWMNMCDGRGQRGVFRQYEGPGIL